MMTEPLSTFFDEDEHGTRAWFDGADTDDNDAAIIVIFDSEYVDFGDDVASTNPTAMAQAADVTSLAYALDKDLVIGSTTYKIRNARPDLTGDILELELEQQGSL